LIIVVFLIQNKKIILIIFILKIIFIFLFETKTYNKTAAPSLINLAC